MNFKIFFLTVNGEIQAWERAQNLFALIPQEIQDYIECINIEGTGKDLNFLRDMGLKFKPVGLINEIYMSENPRSLDRFIAHYSIYQKIINEDIDGCMVFEDEVCVSDMVNLLLLNLDLPENVDIATFSVAGLESFNAYYVTNAGARNILDKITNTKWLNALKKFQPRDYGLDEDLNTFEAFSSEPLQDFSTENQIVAPINQIVKAACQHGKLKFSNNISFVNSIANYNTFEIKNDLKDLSEKELSEIIDSKEFKFWTKRSSVNNSLFDCVFYINLDQDLEKMARTESMLEQISVPFERFSAVKPKAEDVEAGGQYKTIYNKSKILEARAYFSETLDWIDLEKYQLGTLGCYLSHYKLLERIYSMKDFIKYAIIIEDDCYINEESIREVGFIADQIKEWDIIRSTWAAPKFHYKINYCHPLSNHFEPFMQKHIFNSIRRIRNDYPSVCPVVNTFCGGTHFQAINVQSIPKILEYLDSEILIPIDSLYNTTKLDIYNIKMNISHDMFEASSILTHYK